MRTDDLRAFLDAQVDRFNRPDFIPHDPIAIPHRYTRKQDIEIAGLIAAVFAWGNRQTIIRKSLEFLERMDHEPHAFVLHHSDEDLRAFLSFKHRTFQPTDALYFLHFLKSHYTRHDSLETLFLPGQPLEKGLAHFHESFFSLPEAPDRTRKHIPTPARKSTCKRLNMYLRWMVRQDDRGVDFGLWTNISPSQLICPIDVHVGNIARKLGLLHRPINDWNAAVELTENLRQLDADDPVKYDFALFGMGVSGESALIVEPLG